MQMFPSPRVLETIGRFARHCRETHRAHSSRNRRRDAVSTEQRNAKMSMFGNLGRSIMRQHNDAKTRSLMNSLSPEPRKDIGWEAAPCSREKARLAQIVFAGTR